MTDADPRDAVLQNAMRDAFALTRIALAGQDEPAVLMGVLDDDDAYAVPLTFVQLAGLAARAVHELADARSVPATDILDGWSAEYEESLA